MNYKTDFIGDDIINIEVDDAAKAQYIATQLRQNKEWEDVVPGLLSVCIRYNPLNVEPEIAIEKVQSTLQSLSNDTNQEKQTLTIPIKYGGKEGPDFKDVCEALKITEDEFIKKHTAQTYPVEMIGFLPGFAYIQSFENSGSISRLSTPRARVPAGSVGFISGYTGLYPLAGPGGWPIIGRTDKTLFEPAEDDPFIIQAGYNIQFEAV